jgi:hypothetical protein
MSIVSYFRKTLKLMFGLGKSEDFEISILNILIIAILLGSMFVVGNGLLLIWILTLAT